MLLGSSKRMNLSLTGISESQKFLESEVTPMPLSMEELHQKESLRLEVSPLKRLSWRTINIDVVRPDRIYAPRIDNGENRIIFPYCQS